MFYQYIFSVALTISLISGNTIFAGGSANETSQKVIVFNWDGVLANTRMVYWRYAIKSARKYNYTAPANSVDAFRFFPYYDMLDELGFPSNRCDDYMKNLIQKLETLAPKTQLVEGIPEVIEQLKTDGYKLCIMCHGSSDRVIGVLNRYKLTAYFEDIMTLSPDRDTAAINEKSYDLQDCLCITDESYAAGLFKKEGVKVVGACWGNNSGEGFAAYPPSRKVPLIPTVSTLRESIPLAYKHYLENK